MKWRTWSEIKARKAKRAEKSRQIFGSKSRLTRAGNNLRKYLVKALDEVFSLFIRLRDKRARGECPFYHTKIGRSGGKRIECCFHFITRAKFATRWDENNAIGACHGCNLLMEEDPSQFISFFIAMWGLPAWEDLRRKSNVSPKFTNDELRNLTDFFRTKLATVQIRQTL